MIKIRESGAAAARTVQRVRTQHVVICEIIQDATQLIDARAVEMFREGFEDAARAELNRLEAVIARVLGVLDHLRQIEERTLLGRNKRIAFEDVLDGESTAATDIEEGEALVGELRLHPCEVVYPFEGVHGAHALQDAVEFIVERWVVVQYLVDVPVWAIHGHTKESDLGVLRRGEAMLVEEGRQLR